MRAESKTALFLGAAVAAFVAAGAARAQQAPPAPTATPAASTVETVVVTATRRSENVQNVAGQVTALTAAALDQMHAHSFADFADYVPGLSYQSGGPTNNLIAIRGITTGGTQLGSAIGLYLDDVPLGASTQFGLGFQALNINVFDLDRVEVLNGPQGTLYGANALGGALRYITAPPDLDTYDAVGEAEGSDTEHGSYNDGLRLMANVPLFDGQAAIRLDGIQQFDSGYTQDPTYGRTDVGSARTLGGRAQLLWQVTPDIDVRFSAFTQNIAGFGADVGFYNFVTHQPVVGPYDQSYVLPQPSDSSLSLYSGVVDWDFHWAKLTSITGYQHDYGAYHSDLTPLYDFLLAGFGVDGTPFALTVDDDTRKFTQEVRLTSPNSNVFEWVLGGYYDREITDEGVDLIDGATANGELPFFNALPFYGYLPSTYRELAVYADGTYFITNRLNVTLGIRYSHQDQNYQSYISTLLLYPNYSTIYHYQTSSSGGVATYLINPQYYLTDDTMIYARVASGFRPGGPNFVLPPPFIEVPSTFKPDTLWNYELGEKSTVLDGAGTVDFDVYDIEWSNIQATENVGGINQLVNAGDARVDGAEASFGYRILPELTVGGSGAWTDAYLTTPSPVLGVLTRGAQLPLSGRWNFALNGTYGFDIGGGFSGALNLSDVYVGPRNAGYNVSPEELAVGTGNPLYKLAGYNTVNFDLSLFMPRDTQLDFYVKNVFDVRGQVSASTVEDQYLNPDFLGLGVPYAPVPVYLSLPRTFGLVLRVAVH